MVNWFTNILLLSVLQFKSIISNEIIDITKDFYSNHSVNIKFAFKATINQSHLTSSFKSELTLSNEANYFIILSNVTHFDDSTKPDCYPIFMGYAYPYILDNGDVGIKPPYMKYSFRDNEAKTFSDIIPFRQEDKFYLKYFQNKKCTRTASVVRILWLLAYSPLNVSCPRQNQWMFILEDQFHEIDRKMCIDKYPDIDQKNRLESFGAIFLNYTEKIPDSTLGQADNLIILIIIGPVILFFAIMIMTVWLIRKRVAIKGKTKDGGNDEFEIVSNQIKSLNEFISMANKDEFDSQFFQENMKKITHLLSQAECVMRSMKKQSNPSDEHHEDEDADAIPQNTGEYQSGSLIEMESVSRRVQSFSGSFNLLKSRANTTLASNYQSSREDMNKICQFVSEATSVIQSMKSSSDLCGSSNVVSEVAFRTPIGRGRIGKFIFTLGVTLKWYSQTLDISLDGLSNIKNTR